MFLIFFFFWLFSLVTLVISCFCIGNYYFINLLFWGCKQEVLFLCIMIKLLLLFPVICVHVWIADAY